MRRALITLSLLCVYLIANAQSYTQMLRQKNEASNGSVIIYQDTELEALLNGKSILKYIVKKKTTEKDNKRLPKKNNAQNRTKLDKDVIKVQQDSTQSSSLLMNKTYSNRHSQVGYRVQLFQGGSSRVSRQKASQKATLFKNIYPSIPAYTHFNSPYWICRVGNFVTQKEAKDFVDKLRQIPEFSDARVVKCNIMVR